MSELEAPKLLVIDLSSVIFTKCLRRAVGEEVAVYHEGLEEVGDGVWSIYLCDVLLGRVDERDHITRT